MERLEVIQTLINKKKLQRYLEIGVLGGGVFFHVRCWKKVAVDPEFRFNWKGKLGQILKNPTNLNASYFEETSDVFFSKHASQVFKPGTLDIVLIDGMHEFTFVLRDIVNSIMYLSDNGFILVHDCNPLSGKAAGSYEEWVSSNYDGPWNGDVWKAIAYLRATRKDLEIFVADCDHGIAVIRKNGIPPSDPMPGQFDVFQRMTYQEFERNRTQLINLKPVSFLHDFLNKM